MFSPLFAGVGDGADFRLIRRGALASDFLCLFFMKCVDGLLGQVVMSLSANCARSATAA